MVLPVLKRIDRTQGPIVLLGTAEVLAKTFDHSVASGHLADLDVFVRAVRTCNISRSADDCVDAGRLVKPCPRAVADRSKRFFSGQLLQQFGERRVSGKRRRRILA